jgi:hypothetical protein
VTAGSALSSARLRLGKRVLAPLVEFPLPHQTCIEIGHGAVTIIMVTRLDAEILRIWNGS